MHTTYTYVYYNAYIFINVYYKLQGLYSNKIFEL